MGSQYMQGEDLSQWAITLDPKNKSLKNNSGLDQGLALEVAEGEGRTGQVWGLRKRFFWLSW